MAVVTDSVPERLGSGMARLAALLARTFGPNAGNVLCTGIDREYELLSSSGPLARRILALPDRADNAGAMLLRHAVWRMHEQVGDGGALTALLTQALLEKGMRLVRAGFDTAAVRSGLQQAEDATVQALQAQSRPVRPEQVLRCAFGATELTDRIAGLCTEIGPETYVDIREHPAPGTSARTIPGGRWNAEPLLPSLSDGFRHELVLTDPYILVTDAAISDTGDLAGILDAVLDEDGGPVLIVAKDVSGAALRLLRVNQRLIPVAVCRLAAESSWRDHLDDLALCTRARFLGEHLGTRIADAHLEDLGYAQHVRLRPDAIEVLGGAGDAGECRARTQSLYRLLENETGDSRRDTLRRRIGNLAARTAVLRLGGMHEAELAAARTTAARAIRLAGSAARTGAVPGGGAALLHCQGRLATVGCDDPGQAAGIRLLRDALEAPVRRLARDRPEVPTLVREAGSPYGYDAMTDRITDLRRAGILDATAVVQQSVRTAVSTAGTALAAAALVRRKTPDASLEP